MRKIAAALAAAMLALALAGCTSDEPEVLTGTIDDVVVGVADDGSPTVEYPEDREWRKIGTRVSWDGNGNILDKGDPILLDIYAVSLLTGEVVRSTWDSGDGESGLPQPALLTADHIGSELYNALVGKREGVRIVHVSPEAEGWESVGAVALVVDVVPTRAMGEPQGARPDLPIVTLGENGEPLVTLRDLGEPEELIAATLIQGSGEQIRKGSKVLMNYVAIQYDTGEVWKTTWSADKAPLEIQLGVGNTFLGLDNGLIDQAAGSQVLLMVPKTMANGEHAYVFVVDILAVWNGDN